MTLALMQSIENVRDRASRELSRIVLCMMEIFVDFRRLPWQNSKTAQTISRFSKSCRLETRGARQYKSHPASGVVPIGRGCFCSLIRDAGAQVIIKRVSCRTPDLRSILTEFAPKQARVSRLPGIVDFPLRSVTFMYEAVCRTVSLDV